MPLLSYREPDGRMVEVEFRDNLNIGRFTGEPSAPERGELRLQDPMISGRHARIERTFRGLEFFDCGSRNGSRVNGQRLEGYHVLAEGDVLGVGSTMLTYRESRKHGVTFVYEGGGTSAGVQSRLQRTSDTGFLRADRIDDVESLRGEYEKLRMAHELSRAISDDVDLDKLLERVLNSAIEVFHADRGVILLHNPLNNEYEPACVRHRDPASAGDEVVISRTILSEVIEERTGVLSHDATIDDRFSAAHSVMMQGMRSTLSVPLICQNELLGVMHLDSAIQSTIFTDRDLHLLNGFALQAARAIRYCRLAERKEQETVARNQLMRLLPAEIVNDVLSGKTDLARGGELRDATVLFCDIRGFTSMSEASSAPRIVEMLNDYFELMVEQVFLTGGSLDKFIGDEIMAVWGAHIPLEDHAFKAVTAAVGMQRSIVSFNELRQQRGLQPIYAGIGVNTGELVAGYMGSSRSMSYTVIGDTVNVAARLCSAASPGEVVVSRDVIERLHGRFPFEQLPARALKGKTQNVDLFRVLGH